MQDLPTLSRALPANCSQMAQSRELAKDSTISSKLSEYDNVPNLPKNYYVHAGSLPQTTRRGVYSFPVPHHHQPNPRVNHQQLQSTQERRHHQQHNYIKQHCQQQEVQEQSSRLIATPDSRVRHTESYGGEIPRGASCFFYLLVSVAEILLFGIEVLVLIWAYKYRKGFAWTSDPKKEFNFHPVLMITGFIFFMGHSLIVYRQYRCCSKSATKVLHTILHMLAVPCIVVATIAVFDSHNLANPPIPNLYSLHSWLGLVTIGLFALQFVVGFFSFWFLICCEQSTSSFRAALLPIHSSFGIVIFMLAIATAVTGYTEKAIFSLKSEYAQFVEETWVINAQAMVLAALAVVMGYLLYTPRYSRSSSAAIVEAPSTSHYVMTPKTNYYYYRNHEA
ncbi:plasma membrane ascorbate-dependent reductase CYBRD1-like isoform X2 [Oratosquilla oratoria]|uniref:plasma membrane ascorbate-dependent reductase CYBRD1-like isoform X2 n=1 Tax=Oratosquilla oratoria TaxID=337810 RepID=UPI003F766313